ncbi:MAG: hypothetical protein JRD68_09970 [Deltaproteobacteria bacterium]|nr:hypothetical protein [Deltaproteobacteria bacterium]
MTAHQAPVNANIQYTSVLSENNANELTLWQRLLLALKIVFVKDTVVDQTPHDRGYIPFETTRKETAPFDPYASNSKFDLGRVI